MSVPVSYADVHVMAPPDAQDEAPACPPGLEGIVFFGPDSKARGEEFRRWYPDQWWQHAEDLDRIVGENNARFPSRRAQVVDLQLEPARLLNFLHQPQEWWPLCLSLKDSRRYLRLQIPAGTTALSGAKKVINRYPDTQFWVDPFRYGPGEGWQGHVRLASFPNVMLTTLGLFPGPGSRWSEAEALEAVRFTVGEVGASALLYASGLDWESLVKGLDRPWLTWLAECPELDAQERALVMVENAQEIFSDFNREEGGLGL